MDGVDEGTEHLDGTTRPHTLSLSTRLLPAEEERSSTSSSSPSSTCRERDCVSLRGGGEDTGDLRHR
jgi:hypothetical protein